MKNFKKILISTFLSGVCLVFSSPVFAGNSLSSMQTTASDVIRKLYFIEKKVPFESKSQILKELELVITYLEELKAVIKPQHRLAVLRPILDKFSGILEELGGLNDEQNKRIDNLNRRKLYITMPPAPRIRPMSIDTKDFLH